MRARRESVGPYYILSMSRKSDFWFWWLGNRFIWLFILGLPLYLIGIHAVFEIRYFFSASHVSGNVRSYGVNAEGIGGSGSYGSWTKIHYRPWIEVERPSNSNNNIKICRIEGQLGVFGDWLSDDEVQVRQALEKVVADGFIEFYIVEENQPLGQKSFGAICRVKKAVDTYAIGIFMVLLPINFAMLVWVFGSLNYRKYKKDMKSI